MSRLHLKGWGARRDDQCSSSEKVVVTGNDLEDRMGKSVPHSLFPVYRVLKIKTFDTFKILFPFILYLVVVKRYVDNTLFFLNFLSGRSVRKDSDGL